MGCCKVEAIISVDERGQMVLPKETREMLDIRPGEKMALISWERDGKVCCLQLIKADELARITKDALGPLLNSL